MQSITVSKIERAHGRLMYWWPFQSRRQVLSFATFFVGSLLLEAAFLYYLLPPEYLVNCLIGGALCAIYLGIYRVLPARLTLVTRAEARHFMADLQPMILALGYRQSEQPLQPGRLHFCNKAPRWASWDEQDFEVRIGEHDIVLRGPIASLELLRPRLLKQLAA